MVRVMGWGIPEQGWRKGPWTSEEDKLLTEYVSLHGEGRWSSVARSAGLNRSGKSCRLRWVNYLRPGLKRGQLTPQEEGIIIELHALWGNKWSTIARCLPGRTDNEIKNYWRTHFKKPSQNRGKHKTQAMERQKQQKKQQQQQQQQQQQHQLEQQQQQQQHHPIDMQRILSHLAEGDYRMPLPQTRQEMIFMYPTLEDQCFPVMFQEGTSLGDSMGEEGLWGGLWNLDDVPAHFDQPCDTNKVTWQNQASSLLGGK